MRLSKPKYKIKYLEKIRSVQRERERERERGVGGQICRRCQLTGFWTGGKVLIVEDALEIFFFKILQMFLLLSITSPKILFHFVGDGFLILILFKHDFQLAICFYL